LYFSPDANTLCKDKNVNNDNGTFQQLLSVSNDERQVKLTKNKDFRHMYSLTI